MFLDSTPVLPAWKRKLVVDYNPEYKGVQWGQEEAHRAGRASGLSDLITFPVWLLLPAGLTLFMQLNLYENRPQVPIFLITLAIAHFGTHTWLLAPFQLFLTSNNPSSLLRSCHALESDIRYHDSFDFCFPLFPFSIQWWVASSLQPPCLLPTCTGKHAYPGPSQLQIFAFLYLGISYMCRSPVGFFQLQRRIHILTKVKSKWGVFRRRKDRWQIRSSSQREKSTFQGQW